MEEDDEDEEGDGARMTSVKKKKKGEEKIDQNRSWEGESDQTNDTIQKEKKKNKKFQ